ncbi:hypothetical protein CBR_g3785 [Chara braunii]|uniref:Chromatin-remodeling ATPase INO80 n=1 Tax=Chara braunii TaxID=69332 RepID=A0A388KGF3_CHABU|nr:hypothetical protein CBR_g3785 [Chara braunii]|eukprot:GBG69087.1 hypothetical protein CBR_g3785 [Chara braunii]
MCGKLALLDRLLVRLKEAKHKVLIFSQMTRMLDILDYYLDEKGHHPCRLDGQVRQEVRQQQIADFNSKPETFVFLLSTRAGGLGINLTAADTVIIYDSDWNPHQDMQAMDRCHRIGQTKPVHVYRLATSQSVEGRMLAVAGNKLKLEKVVITKGNFRQESVPQKEAVKDEDVLELLKADESTLDDICQSCDVSDEDLARVLDRSDLTKTFDPSKTPPLPMKGPGWAVVQGGTSGSVLKSVE